jgi:hypothetical protein
MSAFSLQRILPVLLASAFTCGSVCAEEETDKLSAAEIEQLDSLRFSYDLAREEITQKQWVEPMEKLRKGYREKLQKVQDNFAQSGDLKKALAARTAIKTDPTAATINAAVKEIASVQRIFTNTQKRMQEKLKQSLTQLARSYVTQLTAIKDKLTKDKRLDSALSIDDEIQKFVAALSLLTIDDLRKPSLNSGSSKKLKDGLVAYYPFTGNAKDESGNDHNAEVVVATLTTDRFGVANSAYLFNGSNSYISIPHHSDFNFTDAFTIGTWFTIRSGHGWKHLVNKTHDSIDGPPNGFRLANPGNILFGEVAGQNIKTEKELPDVSSKWRHGMVVYDGKLIHLYLDSILKISSKVGDRPNLSNRYSLMIGAQSKNRGYHNGKIDDIRIYNRALSAKEVSAIYDSEKPVSNELKKSLGVTKFPQRPLPSFSDKPNPVSDYQWEVINGKVTIVKFIGGGGKVVIPNRIDAKPVTSIGTEAFRRCTKLTSITIPDGVTSIEGSAFYDCTSLTSITIPDSVTSIGYNAFRECRGLTSITIPDSVTSIENGAFLHCRSLTSVTIPDNVTSIGREAFFGCKGLTSVTIGDGVTSIGERIFIHCRGLTSVTIGDGVTSIGYSAFEDDASLTVVTFLGNAPKAGEGVFKDSTPTIYRKPEAKGWGDTFGGRPVKLISEKP